MSVSAGSEVYQHLKTSEPGWSVSWGDASCSPVAGGGGGLPPGGGVLPGGMLPGGMPVPPVLASLPQPISETTESTTRLDRSIRTSFVQTEEQASDQNLSTWKNERHCRILQHLCKNIRRGFSQSKA